MGTTYRDCYTMFNILSFPIKIRGFILYKAGSKRNVVLPKGARTIYRNKLGTTRILP